ncbi:MAG: 3-hydroxyacyl-CoA dehydrogenase [Rhizobium sp.]|nr:3-hydroxyacyl-CoA dehydrogenase [Rhizobium sp.]
MQLRDRVFIVTGAGSGLGEAVTRMLVSEGGRVLGIDINRASGETLAAELGNSVIFKAGDVTDEADIAEALDLAKRHFGHVHGLVNCAGVAPSEKVLGQHGPHALESFVRAVSINLVGTFNMLRMTADLIAKEEPDAGGERGIIINTASIAAFDGQIGQAAYAASKGGVAALTLPAARELARHGIRVMTIAPGIFETPMMSGLPRQVQDALGASVPFPPRLGRPEEYAALVKHICENTMLNGEVIRLDGALRMAPR